MCRQVLIEEQQLAREVAQSYEDRIVELLKQVQAREELLSGKKNKPANSDNAVRTNFYEGYRHAEMEMFLKNVIRALNLELDQRNMEKSQLRMELERQTNRVLVLEESLRNVPVQSDKITNRKFLNESLGEELVLFDEDLEKEPKTSDVGSENIESFDLSDSSPIE
jgi:hypothetical protein